MKRILTLLFSLIFVTTCFAGNKVNRNSSVPLEVSFVQSASTATFKPIADSKTIYTLILTDVNPIVAYFADRPQRKYGHLGMNNFLATWGAGTNSFEVDAPNAVVSGMVRDNGKLKTVNVFVELANPSYNLKKHTLTYQVNVIDKMNVTGLQLNYVTLFIDGVCLSCIANGG